AVLFCPFVVCLGSFPLVLLYCCTFVSSFFFFQAEDGIRDRNVTGVQTCALPISGCFWLAPDHFQLGADFYVWVDDGKRQAALFEIGRASCREKRVDVGGGGYIKTKNRRRFIEILIRC